MKIAIIGGGISGNTVATHLHKEHDITLFESESHLGGHTHTHDIEWGGKHYAIDTGFIVFNDRTYPNFIRMLDDHGVARQPTEMSFSVSNPAEGLEYNGHSLDTLFAQRSNIFKPRFHRMIWEIMRFNRDALKLLDSNNTEITLGQYLYEQGYQKSFIENYIVPMGAAIWSSDPGVMYDFPAAFFIRFFKNHGLLDIRNRPQWYVIKGGSNQYVKAISALYGDRVELNTPVEWVKRVNQQVLVKPRNQMVRNFDAVFFATHSDQALKLLADDATSLERNILGAIPYQENEAVLHIDRNLLPAKRKAWASWNYNVEDSGRQGAALTYHMNTLQSLDAPVEFCVTLNSTQRIDPKKIIKKMTYYHPMFTLDGMSAQSRQKQINTNRTFFCGAYWRNGFHEDGVVSALHAIEHFSEVSDEQRYLRRAG